MKAIAPPLPFGCGPSESGYPLAAVCLRESLDVVHLESEMRQVRPDLHRTALIKFAELDFLFAPGRFQKNQLRAAAGSMPAHLFEAEDIAVK